MLQRRLASLALLLVAACGGTHRTLPTTTSTDMTVYGVKPGTPPANHRPVAAACPTMPTGSDCRIDSDCSSTEICACDADSPSGDNRCVGGLCHLDSDCGSGGYCSPSPDVSTCGSSLSSTVTGYFCHTANDVCNNDDDCTTGSFCVYSPEGTTGAWFCVSPFCAG